MKLFNFETLSLKDPKIVWIIWIVLLIITILLSVITKLYYNKKTSIYGYKKSIKVIQSGYLRDSIIFFIILIALTFFFPSPKNFQLWIKGICYFSVIAILIYIITSFISSIQFFKLLKTDSRYSSLPPFPPSLLFVWFALLIGFTYLVTDSSFLLGGFYGLCILGIWNLFEYKNFFRKTHEKIKETITYKKNFFVKFWIIIFWIVGSLILGFAILLISFHVFSNIIHILPSKKNTLTSNDLEGIIYGNNKFVAVGENGTILTSKDGIHWILQNSGVTHTLDGITYAKNEFVVVGTSGTILTSSDGKIWTKRNSGTIDYIYSITYGDNKFVAVGDNGIILTSLDGKTWASQHLRIDYWSGNIIKGITYGNNKFVAIGWNNKILTSINGEKWMMKNISVSNNFNSITYGDNKFVAVGNDGIILTSSDGKTWGRYTSKPYTDFEGITFSNKEFIAVGYGGIILTSTDGAIWISHSSRRNNFLNAITYGDNKFVAVGDSGIILNILPKNWRIKQIERLKK